MSKYIEIFLKNHVLANLLFALILGMGYISYQNMPREQNPTINFNWIQITTLYSGASSSEMEKLVTEPLEEAIQKISNIKFVSSNSREGVSSILVRFDDIDEDTFDSLLQDLRREIQNKEADLPFEAKKPKILEITSANSFPTAIVAIVGQADDEILRKNSVRFKEDLERIKGVDRIEAFGLHSPELQVLYKPESLVKHNINSIDLASTIKSYFKDLSAGTTKVGNEEWLVRWIGQNDNPQYVNNIPLLFTEKEIQLGEVATIQRAREKPTRLVSYQGKHAVMLSIMKSENTNTLALVDTIKQQLNNWNLKTPSTGIEIVLLDDRTEITKNALDIMTNNAIAGLFLVLLSTWAFLGFRIASFVSIGIPFTLSCTLIYLNAIGSTLNVSVLLGIVITLGMIVDDSVVVIEAIHFNLMQGMYKTKATLSALKEVFAPVTTSVLTTCAAFTPLMMLPGILGKFMMVIPLVVTVALALSLIEAYWMLPAHMLSSTHYHNSANKVQIIRNKCIQKLRINYIKLLIKVLRRPAAAIGSLIALFVFSAMIITSGVIPVNFFANDPLRIFYINVEMPPGTSVRHSLNQTKLIEDKVRKYISEEEVRSIASYAGLMFTETETRLGDQYGQIVISLNPKNKYLRPVDEVIDSMRKDVINSAGPINISFLRLSGGPPTAKPINIKVRGTKLDEIRLASAEIKEFLAGKSSVFDITDDDSTGRKELVITPNNDAIYRNNIDPSIIPRYLRQMMDGEIILDFLSEGEKVNVRLKSQNTSYSGINDILNQTIIVNGKEVRLSELTNVTTQHSQSNIRHYNFRRTITILADLDKLTTDTVSINQEIKQFWRTIASKHPNIDLNFTGELDDIQESLDAMPKLFLVGIGLIYLILGTQFKSYWQPLLIISTVPLAFMGVSIGLLLSGNPLSLYTLYGIVALSGITVNASIVLISAANNRLNQQFSLIHATIYAARRRLIPIVITSVTTIAGLFSLATGLGGKSLLWGPVATSIVWGLFFSTFLTLFFIPLLYCLVMSKSSRRILRSHTKY